MELKLPKLGSDFENKFGDCLSHLVEPSLFEYLFIF